MKRRWRNEPDKMWQRKDGMKDEEKGGEDGPVELVEQT